MNRRTDGIRPGIGAGDCVTILDDARDHHQRLLQPRRHSRLLGLPHLSHIPSAPVSMAEAAPWINSRFAGAPAPVNCGTF